MFSRVSSGQHLKRLDLAVLPLHAQVTLKALGLVSCTPARAVPVAASVDLAGQNFPGSHDHKKKTWAVRLQQVCCKHLNDRCQVF